MAATKSFEEPKEQRVSTFEVIMPYAMEGYKPLRLLAGAMFADLETYDLLLHSTESLTLAWTSMKVMVCGVNSAKSNGKDVVCGPRTIGLNFIWR